MTEAIIGGAIGTVATIIIALISSLLFFGRKFEQLENLREFAKTTENKIAEFDREISAIKEFKTGTQKFIDSKIYQSKSPLSLTDFGKKLINESGFTSIFETEKDNLVIKLLQKQPQTRYDVQEKARELMSELTEYAPFQPLKKYAFETGNDYSQILRAGSVPLRDYFFKKHPEIK